MADVAEATSSEPLVQASVPWFLVTTLAANQIFVLPVGSQAVKITFPSPGKASIGLM
jgi:hypothetical protein